MGSRKISFEPPARFIGWPVLTVMKVSLCGPHSLETSTFGPTVAELLLPALGLAACVERYWYLFHQLGLSGVLFWQMALTEANKMSSVNSAVRKDGIGSPLRVRLRAAASDHKPVLRATWKMREQGCVGRKERSQFPSVRPNLHDSAVRCALNLTLSSLGPQRKMQALRVVVRGGAGICFSFQNPERKSGSPAPLQPNVGGVNDLAAAR